MPHRLSHRVLLAGALLALGGCLSGSRVVRTDSPGEHPADEGRALDLTMGLASDPALAALLAEVSADSIRAVDSLLVSFGTRHTMSDTVSATRGIGAARRWIHARLAEYSRRCDGCLRVEYDAAMVVVERHPQKPSINVVNVLAWLPGRDTSRVIVMGGHYDSCVCSTDRFDVTTDAPGADDDGSGTSAVMELARVFSWTRRACASLQPSRTTARAASSAVTCGRSATSTSAGSR